MTPLQQSISKCKVEGNVLFLPSISEGALPNYNEVKTVLLKAGATYKRNTFVFPKAAQSYVDRIMQGDKVNIKKEFQFFGTPDVLADKLVTKANIKKNHKILEPSAGQAAIVNAIARKISDVRVDCCELLDTNKSVLENHSNVQFICDDFLKMPAQYEGYYDRIIANPPFNKNQDIDHIRKMYDCLKKDGCLVSVASKSWHSGTQKKQVAFCEWLNELEAKIEEIPPGSFKESGTAVGGFIITIVKKS